MVKTKVEPGVCGFTADIKAELRDYQFVTLKVNSKCENIIKISALLKEFDAYNEIKEGFNGEFYKIIILHLAVMLCMRQKTWIYF